MSRLRWSLCVSFSVWCAHGVSSVRACGGAPSLKPVNISRRSYARVAHGRTGDHTRVRTRGGTHSHCHSMHTLVVPSCCCSTSVVVVSSGGGGVGWIGWVVFSSRRVASRREFNR